MPKLDKESIKKEFDTMRDKVLYVLEMDEHSRNSDNRLLCKYLQEFTTYRVIDLSRLNNLIKINAKDIFCSFDLNKITEKILKLIKKELSNIPILKLFPNYQTIDRWRRKIQNEEELFIPTAFEVAEKRNIRSELIREYFINQHQIEETD